jgi:hypothetical protein
MRFEYAVERHHEGKTPEEVDALLDARGAEGWEMITAVHLVTAPMIVYYFKRAVPLEPEPDWQSDLVAARQPGPA